MIQVLFDGRCPQCVKDRHWYEKFSGYNTDAVVWTDINGNENILMQQGINPRDALMELHIVQDGMVIKSIPAYQVLFEQIWFFKPLSWFMGLPLVHELLTDWYQKRVRERLERTGRLV